ncbi:MAG: element excision factor XisH family protein, partial [Blastocatellia bacterium]
MAAKDFYHEHVRKALIKDGWTITDDPLSMKWLGTTLQIDFGAERLITAEKGEEKIAAEVKSFIGVSLIEDLRDALGQFLIYRASLKIHEPKRALY